MTQLTPKEEAIQLVGKFYIPFNLTSQAAKECAIICVNKIIESHTDNLNGDNIKQKEHYQQVLQEISKL